MSNFKVGDRVIVVRLADSFQPYTGIDPESIIGTVFIIHNVTANVPFPYLNSDLRLAFAEDELELAEVYNSPLYKALL